MKQSFQGTISGAGYGYVYVMSYPGSDKVKIGHTLNPTTRAADIGGTLAPETPIVEAYFWCAERREDVERAAHRIESATRCNGEWFKCSVAHALDVIKQAAGQVGVEVQLTYDRNEWEAKAAAELNEKMLALEAMTDAEVANEANRLYWIRVTKGLDGTWVKHKFGRAYRTPPTMTPHEVLVDNEASKRKAAAETAAKMAEEAAKEEQRRMAPLIAEENLRRVELQLAEKRVNDLRGDKGTYEFWCAILVMLGGLSFATLFSNNLYVAIVMAAIFWVIATGMWIRVGELKDQLAETIERRDNYSSV